MDAVTSSVEEVTSSEQFTILFIELSIILNFKVISSTELESFLLKEAISLELSIIVFISSLTFFCAVLSSSAVCPNSSPLLSV